MGKRGRAGEEKVVYSRLIRTLLGKYQPYSVSFS